MGNGTGGVRKEKDCYVGFRMDESREKEEGKRGRKREEGKGGEKREEGNEDECSIRATKEEVKG